MIITKTVREMSIIIIITNSKNNSNKISNNNHDHNIKTEAKKEEKNT